MSASTPCRPIAAEPYPFPFDPAACALLVIDMQRDFLEPGGFGDALGNDVSLLRRAIEPIRAAARRVARGAACRCCTRAKAIGPISSDLPPAKKCAAARRRPRALATRVRWAASSCAASPARAHPGADAALPGEIVIDKPGKGAFFATDLHALLEQLGIRQLVVTGVTTEVCVQSTVAKPTTAATTAWCPPTASASYFPEFHAAALKMIAAQGGIFGWVSHSDHLLPALSLL